MNSHYCTSDRNHLFYEAHCSGHGPTSSPKKWTPDVIESGRDLFFGEEGGEPPCGDGALKSVAGEGKEGDWVRKDPDCCSSPLKLLPSQHKVLS